MRTTPTILATRLLVRARLRHVQILSQLAALGSFSKTAETIGLTQPAVTHALAEFERLLEVRLFERHARGVRPTAVGQALLPMARRIIEAVEEMADATYAVASNASDIVRVGAISSAVSSLLTADFLQAMVAR